MGYICSASGKEGEEVREREREGERVRETERGGDMVRE